MSNIRSDAKSKRKTTPNVYRTPSLGYTIQQGEDMLLIISNEPKRKVCKRKRPGAGRARCPAVKVKRKMLNAGIKYKVPAEDAGHKLSRHYSEDYYDRWGQNLPVEILVNIFQLVVNQEGAIPFLCRVGRVCKLWNGAAASPVLWCSVSVGYCWIEPGKTQLPRTELKIQNTICWLAQNRFQIKPMAYYNPYEFKKMFVNQIRTRSIKFVSYICELDVEPLPLGSTPRFDGDSNSLKDKYKYEKENDEVISQHCPRLSSLKLSYCSGITEKSFQSLGSNCPALECIDMQFSELQVEALVSFLDTHGTQIRKILFTYGSKSDRLLSVIAGGCCPELKLLEINTKLDGGYCQLPICIQALQRGCPKLQVFRMLNVTPMPKTSRKASCSTSGFPHLEELCMASSSMSFITNQDLNTLLHGSPNLRVLDVRNCTRITPAVLSTLPCEKLECLYWGLYIGSHNMMSSRKGIHLLTRKWSNTLLELDLTGQAFSEEDLEIAMGNLADGGGADRLRSLNLSGTRITSHALRSIIRQCSVLSYLNLSSCRYLPRGLKRVYRSWEEIQQLLNKLP